MHRLLSASTSPRITLEFGKCKREDWLEWNVRSVGCEVDACEKYGAEEVEALIVVDEGAEETKK